MLTLSLGPVTSRVNFKLYNDVVPKTTENFAQLCNKEQGQGYKGSSFHRIIPNSMLQGGDFTRGNVSNPLVQMFLLVFLSDFRNRVPVVAPSTVTSSPTRTSRRSTTAPVFCPWPTGTARPITSTFSVQTSFFTMLKSQPTPKVRSLGPINARQQKRDPVCLHA